MVNEDNWKHRSRGMTCARCVWFVRKESDEGRLASKLGRCRRRAPTLGGWPAVFESDWCGDHRLDENKLGEVVEAGAPRSG